VAAILNTNRVYSNLAEHHWYKRRIIIVRWSETLIEIPRTLLKEEGKEYIVGPLKSRDWW